MYIVYIVYIRYIGPRALYSVAICVGSHLCICVFVLQLGHYDESIQSFRAALRLKPDHPHAYNNLGNAMRNRGCVQEAIHCYITAIRLMPRFPVAHNNVGSILKEQGG